ncbi:MAG: lipopolysaccharide biosynthesis protein [Pedobacter sp.]|nr:MAG: lipopolysaccharide biosynthesis protein [Pedobacter sp.]
MDIKSFIKLILKYKWVVVLVPLVTVFITYFLVKRLPNQYSSQASIATGLLDPSKKVISDQTVDFFQVSQQFNNIVEKLKMKKIMDIMSYNLIIHELEKPDQAFKTPSKELDSLNTAQKAEVLLLYKQKLANKSILTFEDNLGKYRLQALVNSMGFGEESLLKELNISHADNSDFINIEFTSESPKLSAFVVNTLATEFIANYSNDVSNNQNVSIALLDSLLRKKEADMNVKNAALSSFKRNNGVINLPEQSAAVYNQIATYEARRADAIRTIQSNQGAITVIESKLAGSDSFVAGSSRNDNVAIVELRNQLGEANKNFFDNGFKQSDQKKIDSLTKLINAKTNQNSDDNVYDPKASKQSLVQQKLSLEIELKKAQSSMSSIMAELGKLRSQYNGMVPYDADVQNYVRDADLAVKDYTVALDQYNASKTEKTTGLKLQIDQFGIAGNPLPSKRLLYTAGAGFASVSFVLCALLVVFLLDHSIVTARQLELATKSKMVGTLNYITSDERLARNIWEDKSDNANYELYKEHLRSIRFEILNKMDEDGHKILGVTSLVANAGKTFLSYSLAYAFAMTGRKILLIADEQPFVASESKELTTKQSFQTFLRKKEFHTDDLITVMNKSSEKNSLLEVQSVKSLRSGFDALRQEFDFIIIDVNSLHDVNLSKEWLLFTEKNIAVFESGTTLKETDRDLIKYINAQPGFLGWVLNKTKINLN